MRRRRGFRGALRRGGDGGGGGGALAAALRRRYPSPLQSAWLGWGEIMNTILLFVLFMCCCLRQKSLVLLLPSSIYVEHRSGSGTDDVFVILKF